MAGDNISVSVRVRPLNSRELVSESEGWAVSDSTIYQTTPEGRPVSGSQFTFDNVFDTPVDTQSIYEVVGRPIVDSAMNGFNSTIFAYGQTSSGKTHTILGTDVAPGIIPRAVQDIFEYIENTPEREFLLRVSYMEIYNEVINDLLRADNVNLKIHEDFKGGIFVGELEETVVMSSQQVMDLLSQGQQARHVGATKMNEKSSRSHTIFRMVIESREREMESSESADGAVRVATLHLVDLAGSERATHTGAAGIRLKEGSHINKSLLTLGSVIEKLSEGYAGHIPYRDSKLTRILQPALGGNSRTAIICTVTPAMMHVQETQSTLKFANRAKKIHTHAEVNEVVDDKALLQRYAREIRALKRELSERESDTASVSDVDVSEMEREIQAKHEENQALHEKLERMQNLIVCSKSRSPTPKKLRMSKSRWNRRETWAPSVSDLSFSLSPAPPKAQPSELSAILSPLSGAGTVERSSVLKSSALFDKSLESFKMKEMITTDDSTANDGEISKAQQQEIESLESALKLLREENAAISEQNTALREEMELTKEIHQDEKQLLERKISTLESEIASLKAKKSAQVILDETVEVVAPEVDIDELQEMLNDTITERDQLRSRVEALQMELTAKDEELSTALAKDDSEAICALEARTASAAERMQSVSDEAARVSEDHFHLKAAMDRLANVVEQTRRMSEERSEQNVAVDNSALDSLVASVEALEARMAPLMTMPDEVASTLETVRKMQEQVDAASSAIDERDAKIEELNAEIEELNECKETLMQDIEEAESQNEKLRLQITDLEEQVQDLNGLLTESNVRIDELEAATGNLDEKEFETTELRRELECVKGSLSAAERRIDQLVSDLDEVTADRDVFSERVDQLEKDLGNKRDKCDELDMETQKLRWDLDVATRTNEEQSTLLQNAESELANLKESSQQTEEELCGQIDSLNGEIEEITKKLKAAETKANPPKSRLPVLGGRRMSIAPADMGKDVAEESGSDETEKLKERIAELEKQIASAPKAPNLMGPTTGSLVDNTRMKHELESLKQEAEELRLKLDVERLKAERAESSAEERVNSMIEEMRSETHALESELHDVRGQLARLQADRKQSESAAERAEKDRNRIRDEAEKEKSKTQGQVQTMKERLQELNRQVADLQKELRQAESKRGVAEKSRDMLKKDMEKMKDKMDDLQERVKQHQQAKVSLASDKASADKEMKMMTKRYNQMEKEVEKLRGINGNLNAAEKQCAELGEEKSKLSKELESLQERIQEVQTERDELQSKSDDLEAQLSTATEELTAVKAELEESQAATATSQGEVATLTDTVSSLQSKLDDAESEMDQAKLEHAGVLEERDQLQERCTAAEEKVASLTSELTDASSQRDEAMQHVLDKETTLEEALLKIVGMEDEMTLLKSCIEDTTTKNEKLTVDLTAAQEQMTEMHFKLEEQKMQSTAYETETVTKMESKQQELATLDGENRSLKEQQKELTECKSSLETDLRATKESLDEVSRVLEEREKEMKDRVSLLEADNEEKTMELERQVKDFALEKDALNERIATLTTKIEDNSRQKLALQEEIRHLKADHDASEDNAAEVAMLKAQISVLEHKVGALDEKAKALEAECAELRSEKEHAEEERNAVEQECEEMAECVREKDEEKDRLLAEIDDLRREAKKFQKEKVLHTDNVRLRQALDSNREFLKDLQRENEDLRTRLDTGVPRTPLAPVEPKVRVVSARQSPAAVQVHKENLDPVPPVAAVKTVESASSSPADVSGLLARIRSLQKN